MTNKTPDCDCGACARLSRLLDDDRKARRRLETVLADLREAAHQVDSIHKLNSPYPDWHMADVDHDE